MKGGLWLTLLLVASLSFGETSLKGEAFPITLPDKFFIQFGGEVIDLSGMSGFFVTRSGMESAVEAMETVPILNKRILGLEAAGLQKDAEIATIRRDDFWEDIGIATIGVLLAVLSYGIGASR